jgi:hypothetical protein
VVYQFPSDKADQLDEPHDALALLRHLNIVALSFKHVASDVFQQMTTATLTDDVVTVSR